jgi:hypothetical protein
MLKQQVAKVEAEMAKNNPRVHAMMTRFAKLVEEEQSKLALGLEELKEQAKVASVKSMMRLRRTQAAQKHTALPDAVRRLSTMDEIVKMEATVLKEETLIKQGKDLRIWRQRHFVLRPEGVFYYENEQEFKARPDRPRGRVLFCDLVCPSGQAADEVPRFMYIMLNRPYVFCLHTEDRTFVVSTPSKESLKSWVAAVNAAFNKFMSLQTQKSALMDAVWVVGTPEIWTVANKLTTNNASVEQVLKELLAMLREQFEDDVWNLRQLYSRRKAFDAWRIKTRMNKKRDPIIKASDLS